MSRTLVAAALAVAFAAAPAVAQQQPAAAAAQTGSASQLVQENSSRMLGTLATRRDEFRANPAALQAFIKSEFDQIFDKVYAARLVLGRNGRNASDAEVAAFADALAGNLMHRYGNSLIEVDAGTRIRVTGESELRNGAVTRVTSQIDRRGGAPIPVDYLMRQDGGQWKVFDVIVEGVSFVQTFRSQFDAALRTKSLAQLTEELRAGAVQVDADVVD
ncbi:MlaC/ttg2D family ABC transporter substrate-binding protein [Coralloluteibacterium thermophilus]|uniref:Phospholipid-binding protein MlaC n=1 Tax=Coralloluteibacterium thermophilum TaxID=2707049 RepID=A0ABV9NLE8_9GAMM